VLRDRDGENLREYLIATAARLMAQRGSGGLAVRDIAREAQVADGVLYNYFEDKEDLLAQALLAHVGAVMSEAPQLMPPAGTATVAANLAAFTDRGIAVLTRVVPAFAGLLSQPGVLIRFHAMVGGDAAFGTPPAAGHPTATDTKPPATGTSQPPATDRNPKASDTSPAEEPRGLPDVLKHYLLAEQRLGRVDPAADIEAAATLIVGAIHGQVLPRVFFAPPGAGPVTVPADLGHRLTAVVLSGLAPGRNQA
jgi:AcrR family transcriptional regulator